ncbi:MAG TPA: DUF6010 family protein [Steroidobacteraceae bacterium]
MSITHNLPAVHTLDIVMPALAALLLVLLMSRIREPLLQKIHVLLVAGFATAYLGGGLGIWELLYVPPATYVAYRAMGSYRFVALGWFMHPVWDMVHHFYGNPIWPWMPTSSIGCAIFDPIVGIWALFQARRTLSMPNAQRA